MLEFCYETKRMGVVIETADGSRRGAQRVLAGVTERCMTEIVCERDRLSEVFVQRQDTCQRTGDLRHLQRVREACAIVVPLMLHKDLRLMLQPAEGRRMDDAVAVALIRRPGRAFPL